MRWRAPTVVQRQMRLRASRPQLKRGPLGGALPLDRHSFVNSFVTVIARGAELECSRTSLGLPRPTTPRPRHGCAAPRTTIKVGRPRSCFPTTTSPSVWRGARRARPLRKSAPSNMRLKLTGALVLNEAVVSCPDGHRTFVRHPCAGGRVARSLSAIRRQRQTHSWRTRPMALSFAHIFMTVAAVLAASFGIATAIRAYRSQIRRRWLWILICLLGAPVTTMNWATGQVRTQALRIQIVNVGVVRPGPNAPWFLSVAFPVGAFLFLSRRKKLLADARPLLSEERLQ